jgi:catechol 2,3-dioxygenase-like lactoylglutathione lyase family enzyme
VITGVHALIYSTQAGEVRAFFRDVLGFPSVDAHDGWLIFALPPAELGIHPDESGGRHQLWLMCDEIEATVEELKAKGVEFTKPISDEGFGLVTGMRIPGGELGLYQPKHPVALGLT